MDKVQLGRFFEVYRKTAKYLRYKNIAGMRILRVVTVTVDNTENVFTHRD